jgi:hypothetical protein
MGLAGFILLLAILLRFGWLTPGQPPLATGAVADSTDPTLSIPGRPLSHRASVEALEQAKHSTQPGIGATALEEQRDEASRQRVAELQQMASTRDPGSLDTVLSELKNQDARIRRAALAAAVEIGSRSAIPVLQEAMEGNLEPGEKVSIQQAIEFLQLPTLTEANLGRNAP